MLYINRYPGQAVIIRTRSGETIKVTLMSAESGIPAKLGFDADKSIIIDREEIAHLRSNGNQ